jgi:hypothetical protein
VYFRFIFHQVSAFVQNGGLQYKVTAREALQGGISIRVAIQVAPYFQSIEELDVSGGCIIGN